MSQFHIAVIVGSLRKDSFNRQLATALARLAPADFHLTQLRLDDLPLYNQDDDGQQAAPVLRLKSEIQAAQGLLFVTPEYNRSIPGVLKNAIDHASRPYGQNAWAGKACGGVGRVGRGHRYGAGAAAPAQHPGLPGCAHPGAPEAFIQAKEGVVRCRRPGGPGQPGVFAGLDGSLRGLGEETRLTHSRRAVCGHAVGVRRPVPGAGAAGFGACLGCSQLGNIAPQHPCGALACAAVFDTMPRRQSLNRLFHDTKTPPC